MLCTEYIAPFVSAFLFQFILRLHIFYDISFFLPYADCSEKCIIYTLRIVILRLLNKKDEMFKHTTYGVEEMSVHFSSISSNYLIDKGVEY
jgi:hypothetical protein